MSNDLMIPNKADVPAHILNPELARQANEEAAAGISTGFPARVKLAGGKFALVDGGGEEKAFPASKLFVGPDEVAYLPLIILRAKKALSKNWFASAYNPSDDGKGPDCFSGDAERPDPLALAPQSETCASCAHNAFGSGKDQAGNPTKGKACSDNKIMAAFVPGFGVHMLKVPPGSLKNFGLYVKQLSAAGIPLGNIKTLIGFEPTKTTSELIFRFGGYLPEDTLPKVLELSNSIETAEIIGGTATPAPAITRSPVPSGALASVNAGAEAAAEAAAKAKEAEEAKAKAAEAKAKEAEAKAKAKAEADAAKAAELAAQADVLDMDLGDAVVTDVSDQELRDELGL